MIPIVICGDSHGDAVDRTVARLLKDFVQDFKPRIRVHLGDWMNCEAFREGATPHEKEAGLEDDKNAALEFDAWYKSTHLLDGNHDDRLHQYLAHNRGPLSDYVWNILQETKHAFRRAQRYPYHKSKGICRIGRLKLLHGFYHGVNAPRQMALAYGNCVFGHTHRFGVASATSGGRLAQSNGVGCICRLDMNYNRKQVESLSQAQGWKYGVMDKRGRYWLNDAKIINGQVAIFEHLRIYK